MCAAGGGKGRARVQLSLAAVKRTPVRVAPTARIDVNMPTKSAAVVFGAEEYTIISKTRPVLLTISVNDRKTLRPAPTAKCPIKSLNLGHIGFARIRHELVERTR